MRFFNLLVHAGAPIIQLLDLLVPIGLLGTYSGLKTLYLSLSLSFLLS
jgi:hypothetical protein